MPLGVMVSCEDIGQLRSVVKGQMATFFALKISCKHFAEITIAGNREEVLAASEACRINRFGRISSSYRMLLKPGCHRQSSQTFLPCLISKP